MLGKRSNALRNGDTGMNGCKTQLAIRRPRTVKDFTSMPARRQPQCLRSRRHKTKQGTNTSEGQALKGMFGAAGLKARTKKQLAIRKTVDGPIGARFQLKCKLRDFPHRETTDPAASPNSHSTLQCFGKTQHCLLSLALSRRDNGPSSLGRAPVFHSIPTPRGRLRLKCLSEALSWNSDSLNLVLVPPAKATEHRVMSISD